MDRPCNDLLGIIPLDYRTLHLLANGPHSWDNAPHVRIL